MTDRERGGFYASQDADINLDDDGDYFTWTLEEARAVLDSAELEFASRYWDIGELGDMHHNPAKNVLHVKFSMEELAAQTGRTLDESASVCAIRRAANCSPPAPSVRRLSLIARSIPAGTRWPSPHTSKQPACCDWIRRAISRCSH